MTAQQKKLIFIYALLATPLSGTGVDIYVPSLPNITHYFGTSNALVQLSISIYLFGYGLFSLFFGPLADSIGRKKPLYFGSILFMISSYLITFSSVIQVFLFFRLLQGIAIAAIASVSRAVIPDVFDGKDYRRVINMTTIAWSLGPIVAPYIGGYIDHFIGWKGSFYTLCGYGVALLCCQLFILPETIKEKRTFSIKELGSRYKLMITKLDFLTTAILCGLVYSFIIIFNTVGPFLIQDILHYSSISYGKTALLMGLAFFLGNMSNRFSINTDQHRRIQAAFFVMFIGVAIGLYFLNQPLLKRFHIVLPTFIVILASGTIFPNCYGSALQQFPNFSGTVSSVMTMIFVLTASATSAVSTFLKTSDQIPYILFLAGIAVTMFIAYQLILSPDRNNKS